MTVAKLANNDLQGFPMPIYSVVANIVVDCNNNWIISMTQLNMIHTQQTANGEPLLEYEEIEYCPPCYDDDFIYIVPCED